jgi:hypothetical protein
VTEGEQRERCPEHGLALGPDGSCVLCRRRTARPGRARLVALGVLGLTVAGIGVGLAYRSFRRAEPPASELPPAPPQPPPPAAVPPGYQPYAPPPGVAPRPSPWPTAPAPAPGAAPPDARVVREDPAALAARQRMEQMYRESALRQAMEQVSITMYLTHW